MSAGTIVTGEHIIEISLNDYAGAGIGLEYLQFVSEAISFPNDRVNKIVETLSLHRNLTLQTGQGIIPGRQSAFLQADQAGRKLVRLLFARIDYDGWSISH